MEHEMTASKSRIRRSVRITGLALICGGLIAAGHWFGVTIGESLESASTSNAGMTMLGVAGAVLLAYVVLTAIPFVPGTEVGLALLMVFGARIAVIVYLATVAALTLSFMAGRLIPAERLAAWLAHHGFVRAARLIEAFERLGPDGRDRYLTQNAPPWLKPWLVDHRMITLILLFNLPGNTLLGGGGGIALMTGLSKLMPVRQFLLAVGLAVLPVPTMVLLAS